MLIKQLWQCTLATKCIHWTPHSHAKMVPMLKRNKWVPVRMTTAKTFTPPKNLVWIISVPLNNVCRLKSSGEYLPPSWGSGVLVTGKLSPKRECKPVRNSFFSQYQILGWKIPSAQHYFLEIKYICMFGPKLLVRHNSFSIVHVESFLKRGQCCRYSSCLRTV